MSSPGMSPDFVAATLAEAMATLIDGADIDREASQCLATCDPIGSLEHVPRRFDPEVCAGCGRHVWIDSDLVEVCRIRSMPVVPICLDCDRPQATDRGM